MANDLDLIAVHSGIGGRDRRSALGPEAIKSLGIESELEELGRSASWTDLRPNDDLCRTAAIVELCQRLSSATEASIRAGRLCLVIGGDHSCAVGTWSGIANGLQAPGGLGLIWIDAHLDSHTPETTPSGNWHGMPLAHLLGHGLGGLVRLSRNGPAVQPRHVCLIGGRCYEPEEERLLSELGVRRILQREVDRRGLREAWTEAITIASAATAGFGVSLDLDAIDPEEAPGVGSPVADGISADSLVDALAGVASIPGLRGLEIVEYNPMLDRHDKTLSVIGRLLRAAWRTRKGT